MTTAPTSTPRCGGPPKLMVASWTDSRRCSTTAAGISRHDAEGWPRLSVERRSTCTTVNNALGNVGHTWREAGIELLVDLPAEQVIMGWFCTDQVVRSCVAI